LSQELRRRHQQRLDPPVNSSSGASSGGGDSGVKEGARDVGDVPPGDRPILQLVYTVKDYNDVGNNYGYYELFDDTDIASKRWCIIMMMSVYFVAYR
jgi:hypothetical protein